VVVTVSNPPQTKSEFVEVFLDVVMLTRAAGQRFVRLTQEAVAMRGVFTVALSGASTPKSLYTLMGTDQNPRVSIPWSKIHFFFGDERHVPPDTTESNFRMAHEAWFQHLPPHAPNVHRIHAEQSNAASAASEYEDDLTEFFQGHRVESNHETYAFTPPQ
jgi:6-phosphogluconolactonase